MLTNKLIYSQGGHLVQLWSFQPLEGLCFDLRQQTTAIRELCTGMLQLLLLLAMVVVQHRGPLAAPMPPTPPVD